MRKNTQDTTATYCVAHIDRGSVVGDCFHRILGLNAIRKCVLRTHYLEKCEQNHTKKETDLHGWIGDGLSGDVSSLACHDYTTSNMSVVCDMHLNYSHLECQAGLRNDILPPLMDFLQKRLHCDCFPGHSFDITLYGSLHHGLFIAGRSKINVDVTSREHQIDAERVLQCLTSCTQRWAWSGANDAKRVQHPVLVWHRNVRRPWMMLLWWDGTPVYVTVQNTAGVRVSEFMQATFTEYPLLRLTLLHWKQALVESGLLGPNQNVIYRKRLSYHTLMSTPGR